MSLKLCILASSSSANCTYISSGETSILIDAGLSARETTKRLEAIDVQIGAIDAICVSHEHADHISGLRVLQRRHAVALYANSGTLEAIGRIDGYDELQWRIFSTGSPFHIGNLTIEPFSVPHDAYEPVGFVVSDESVRIGIVTDIGIATELVRQRLASCHAVVMEANYDDDLLKNSPRPWPLKQRIMGRQGHLSNQHAAEMLTAIQSPTLSRVYLAHLSSDCNEPGLALKAMREGVAGTAAARIQIELTYPDRATEPWEVTGEPCRV